ncbi:MAG: NADH-quinone oxidoreductase subunit N [Pirellulaceae bacterium]
MNLHELVSELIIDTKGAVTGGAFTWPSADSSLGVFLPEICLCVTIVLMLLVRVFAWGRKCDAFYFVLVGTGLAFFLSAPWVHLGSTGLPSSDPASVERMEIFTGMLVYDRFTVFIRSVLVGFAFLFAIFTKLSGIPDREDGPDVYTLVLGATLGMCLMASANHLLMVFLAVEMASVPSYVLAGLLKGRRLGSEAALKYSIYGAGAAGVMLYGISLLAGMLNTAHLPTLSARLAEAIPNMESGELTVLALAGLMIMVGLAFKLSAVPFHFWCPDVFEGATAEVNAFLSVASKAAAIALLVRVAIGIGATPAEHFHPGVRSEKMSAVARAVPDELQGEGLFAVALVHEEGNTQNPNGSTGDDPVAKDHAAAQRTAADDRLDPAREFIGKLVAFLAVLTCTFGNLAAYAQTNLKRLLAYSTIAHAGYMMMPVSALMVMAGHDAPAAERAVSAIALYIVVYLFMNLGAFSIVAFLRNAMHSEEIADYAGLIRRCPLTVIFFSLILFSLIGLPPLSGFIGKFAIFATLVDGFQRSAANGAPQAYLLALLVVGGLNTVLSLFYYLRVVKVMTIDPEPAHRTAFVYSEISLQGAFVFLLTVPTALFILNWDVLNRWAIEAARYLLT